ncbi:MAG: superoxide dismutase family protein [Methyloceanibacter sp.]|jgi:Cu-Zn family superoxide dismutase|uniref:superoxide dismutase family protein n=1 Tax=Methyloceanibacter sp. TaxID=1965321 RepID=UPI003C3E961D
MIRTTLCFASVLALQVALAGTAGAAEMAKAVLSDPDGKEVGTVTLTAVPTGVLLNAELTAFPEGTHAFHIHGTGKCEPPSFKSAGGHFNPEEDQHGLENPAGPHAGDMPNIHVPANGKLHIEVMNQMVSLPGLLEGEGTAIVVHEKGDDYVSNPAGDAGPRIACGVINE